MSRDVELSTSDPPSGWPIVDGERIALTTRPTADRVM
jgi:hypothetical protein